MEALIKETYPGMGHVKGREIGIFRTVQSGLPLLPTEVIALSKDGALLIGAVYKRNGNYFCRNGVTILRDITHYATLADIMMTDEFRSLLPK